MNWRKLNRILHRDLGYIFFGMTIIYSVSGIVLNHRKPGGDASIVSRSEVFREKSIQREKFTSDYISHLLDKYEIDPSGYKSYFFPSETKVMIYLKKGHVKYDLETGEGEIVTIKKRPILTEFNFLHYNKPKRLWTLFSDVYAVSLIIVAITGLFIIRGKKGITGRGALLTGLGILIPLIFLIFYFWAA
jgi:hypothetical protein